MIALTSGCPCCTPKGSLLTAAEELRDIAGGGATKQAEKQGI